LGLGASDGRSGGQQRRRERTTQAGRGINQNKQDFATNCLFSHLQHKPRRAMILRETQENCKPKSKTKSSKISQTQQNQ